MCILEKNSKNIESNFVKYLINNKLHVVFQKKRERENCEILTRNHNKDIN